MSEKVDEFGRPVSSPESVEDGWDDVEAQFVAKDQATLDERARCEAIVLGEIERGRLRGIPETSGTMVILFKIASAISNA